MLTLYKASTEAAVATASAAAKSILGVLAPAQFGCDLRSFAVSFDGTDATKTPVLIELIQCTFATNPPGTASTTVTVRQTAGRAITAGFTAARAWTTEPTATTELWWEGFLTPNAGLLGRDWAPNTGLDAPVSQGFVIRATTVAGSGTPNIRATFEFGRC